MSKKIILAGNTVIHPYGLLPKRGVTYEVEFDSGVLPYMLRKAFANKSNATRYGGITVRITSHKEL